jgi:hypothetical protein
MRSSSLAHVGIASLGVSVVITLGCGKSPSAPSPPPGLQPSSASQRAALALFEAASLHAGVATSPLTWVTGEDGEVRWTNGPCDDPKQGSVQGFLDGGVSTLHTDLADRTLTPARFESSITEHWWRVFTATAARI